MELENLSGDAKGQGTSGETVRLKVPMRRPGADHLVVVAHRRRAADPQRMKHLLDCCRVVGTEVGFLLVRCSPCSSWTRGSWSTPDCATGRHRPRSTLLRVLIAGAPRRRRVRS